MGAEVFTPSTNTAIYVDSGGVGISKKDHKDFKYMAFS